MTSSNKKTRIGVIGYGYIGRELCRLIQETQEWNLELAFVWNRDATKLNDLPAGVALAELDQLAERCPDLVVECAHPDITLNYGEVILQVADYLPLSVNAFADPETESKLVAQAQKGRAVQL